MNNAINIELQFFIVSILWGAIILIVYDLLRILRRIISHSSFVIALEDLTFWVLTSVFIFSMVYRMNNGTIRGYSILGMVLGMVLYFITFSELFVRLGSRLLIFILRPLRWLLLQMKKAYYYIMKKIKKILRWLYKQLKKITTYVKMFINKKLQKRIQKLQLKKMARREKAAKRREEKSMGQRGENISDRPIGDSKSYREVKLRRSGSIPVRRYEKPGGQS